MMKKQSDTVLTLEQVEQAAQFEGFAPEDFEVFEAPEFQERMPRLKQRVTPRLKQLATALSDRVGEALDDVVYPHVAQHLRRSVNPPVETWAAFARNARAYKPYVHLRTAINADKVRVLVFVEDDAEEKAVFAENLASNADALAAWMAHHPVIHAYDMEDEAGEIRRGHTLDAGSLRDFAERMTRFKGQHARFGIPFAKSHPVVGNGPELIEAILEAARKLRPLYHCGKPGFVYSYTPEPVAGI